MAWTINNRVTYTSWSSVWNYAIDTYLPSKGFVVSGTGTRQVAKDVTNIWTGGLETVHWSVFNLSTQYPQWNISFFEGDNSSTVNWQIGAPIASPTEFQYWDSESDPTACLITTGRQVALYWPGDSAKWFLRGNPRSRGTADGRDTYLFPAATSANGWVTKGYQANPSDTVTSSRYSAIGYIGYPGEDAPGGNLYGQVPVGAKYMRIQNPILTAGYASTSTGENSNGYGGQGPLVQLNTNDVFIQFGCTPTFRLHRLYLGSQLGFDGTRYWLGNSGTSNQLVFDLGTTEPII